jgi:polyisoprenyl-phosphate glycosyltransferase
MQSISPNYVPRGPLLVAGACGFIGANLCRHFAGLGSSVWAVDGPSGNDWRLKGLAGIERTKVDLRSRAAVHELIAKVEPTVVINCAAYGGYPSQQESDRIYDVNFNSVRYLLEAVRALPRFVAFIQAGSSSEYGINCAGPSEDSATVPDSDYAVSKVAATAITKFYGVQYDVPAWVLRLYSVYGPYEDFSRLVPQMLLRAIEKRFPALVNPTISRDFVFVDDVCEAIQRVIEKAAGLRRGEVYNIGTGIRTSLADLALLVQSVFQVPSAPVWGSMPDRRWDHSDWFSNPTKAKTALSWQAATTMRDGLASTMRWLETNPQAVVDGQRASVVVASAKP